MSDDPEEIIDLDTIDEEILDRHTQLIEENSRMQKGARSRAHKMLRLAVEYDEMAQQCREIATLHVLTATQLSERVADLIAGEFDLEIVEMDDDEDEEDEDDES